MSHHSSHDDEQRRAMSEAMKNLLGEYPNGKLNERDEGGIAVAVYADNGAVCLRFPKPVAWIGFTPEQAMEIAATLVKHARACGCKTPLTLTLGA